MRTATAQPLKAEAKPDKPKIPNPGAETMPVPRLTPQQREQAEALFAQAQASQSQFWNDLFELEQLLGVEVKSDEDLMDSSLDHLLSNH